MSLFITQQVGSPVEGSGSPPFNNQWVAGFNPIIFGFRREDYVFTSVADDGGNCRLVTPAPITTPDYAVGDLIWVSFTSEYTEGFYEIVSIDGNGRPTIALTFGSTAIGYFNASRRIGYYIEIQVNTINGQSLRYTTDKFGLLTANLSGLLISELDINIDYDYEFTVSVTNADKVDDNGLVIPIRYREIYRDFTGAWLGEFDDIKAKAVGGAFQLGAEHSEYYNDYVISDDTLGKPLTLFNTLRFWKGLPFSVSYVFNSSFFLSRKLERKYYNNNTLLSTIERTIGFTTDDYLNYFVVDWEYYSTNAPSANNFTIAITGRFFEFGVNTPKTLITQVNMYTPCNGYYLRWRNSLGGVDYWWFENVKNETEQVQGGGTFAPYFDNIGDARTTGEWNKKESVAKIDLQATGITQDEIEGFKDLLTSPKVEIYLNEKWFTFLIQPTAYKIFEKGNIVDIELIGFLPQKQLQTQ